MQINVRKDLKRIIVVIFAAVMMAFNIKVLVRTGELFPGGATGLTVLIQRLALRYFSVELPYSAINLLLNAFPVYIGFRYIGKKFTLLSLLLILVSGFLLLRSLKPLQIVEGAISGIASGDADLTKRIEINSNNEIGYVVKGFNAFASKLQNIIGDVKSSKDELMVAGENLSGATQDTASSITQIIANIDSMKRQIDGQNQSVNQTAGAVNEIASNIESLERMIESQSSGVTQASAAVEEMIGNISSVNG